MPNSVALEKQLSNQADLQHLMFFRIDYIMNVRVFCKLKAKSQTFQTIGEIFYRREKILVDNFGLSVGMDLIHTLSADIMQDQQTSRPGQNPFEVLKRQPLIGKMWKAIMADHRIKAPMFKRKLMDITLDDAVRGISLGGAATHLMGEIERGDLRTWITLMKNGD